MDFLNLIIRTKKNKKINLLHFLNFYFQNMSFLTFFHQNFSKRFLDADKKMTQMFILKFII